MVKDIRGIIAAEIREEVGIPLSALSVTGECVTTLVGRPYAGILFFAFAGGDRTTMAHVKVLIQVAAHGVTFNVNLDCCFRVRKQLGDIVLIFLAAV